MWHADEFAQAVAETLSAHARALDDEQAVRGLDALDELAFHPLLAEALGADGRVCLREVPYPSQPHPGVSPTQPDAAPGEPHIDLREIADPLTGEIPAPEALAPDPAKSERQRCDLVLLPPGASGLIDAIVARKRARAERARVAGTLFEGVAAAEHEPDPDTALVHPTEALWVEVKVVGQFCCTYGVGGPNRSYASELTRTTIADLRKLVRDPLIEDAALLLVLFTIDHATAEHDLAAFTHRCLDKGLSVTTPVVRTFDVADRIGNRHASVAFVRVRR